MRRRRRREPVAGLLISLQATLLDCEHTIWPISCHRIAWGNDTTISGDILPHQWDVSLFIFFLTSRHSGCTDAFVLYPKLLDHEFSMSRIGFYFPADIRAPDDGVEDFSLLLTTLACAQLLSLDLIGFGKFLLEPIHRCLITGRYIIVTVDYLFDLILGMPKDAWMSPSSDKSDALQVRAHGFLPSLGCVTCSI